MFWSLYLLLFIFGACLGSFYITTAERVLENFYGKKRKSGSIRQRFFLLLTDPSHCTACGKKLNSLELFPILGFLLTRRKCKSCMATISWLYPTSEFLFGSLTLITFLATDSLLFSFSFTMLVGHLIISVYTDATYFSLDYENLPFIIIFGSLANYSLLGKWPQGQDFWVFLGFGVIFWALYKLVKNGMGLADVIFAPVFAFLAGHPFWMLFLNISYLLAIIVTVLNRKKGENLRGKQIPMGVYFSLGLFLTFIGKVLYFQFDVEGFMEN